MFFSKITLNKSDIFDIPLGNEYFIHQSIWEIFTDSSYRCRDFLYRMETTDKIPCVYAVSQRKPLESIKPWVIKIKKYEPKIFENSQFFFKLRANPTLKREGKRHDVVMNHKINSRAVVASKNNLKTYEIIYNAGYKWLKAKAEKNGFQIKQLRADEYKQHKFFKNKGNHIMQYSTIDFTGVLTVTNKELFLNALFEGIGSTKGFGCGLLMVKKYGHK